MLAVPVVADVLVDVLVDVPVDVSVDVDVVLVDGVVDVVEDDGLVVVDEGPLVDGGDDETVVWEEAVPEVEVRPDEVVPVELCSWLASTDASTFESGSSLLLLQAAVPATRAASTTEIRTLFVIVSVLPWG